MCCEERSPLYIASLEIHTEIVELLLNNKADANIYVVKRESPLCIASRHSHTEIMELLLNNKAKPNKCWVGESLLYIASRHGRT
jgi:ankyrin repeat protein